MAISFTARRNLFYSSVIIVILFIFVTTALREKFYSTYKHFVSGVENEHSLTVKTSSQGDNLSSDVSILGKLNDNTVQGRNDVTLEATQYFKPLGRRTTLFSLPKKINDLNPSSQTKTIPNCPLISPLLVGSTNISLGEIVATIMKEKKDAFEVRMRKAGLQIGGRFKPKNCKSRHKVAVVVPYRERRKHLSIFLRYMHPFLQRQQLDYAIVVVEQSDDLPFNRGKLMNIGYKEAEYLQVHFQCFIFHDVDMLPEDDRNLYFCPEDGNARQMAYVLDKFGYKPIYPTYFGGVTALSANDFLLVNGFSNVFWGWGGEDDDLLKRVRLKNITVTRSFDDKSPQIHLVRYGTINHPEAKPNPYRSSLLNETTSRIDFDGLADLKYTKLSLELKPLFTHILVDLKQ